MAPLLSVRHISKQFSGVHALSDVELDLHAGEVHALVGANGSGKSTLIKILSGYHAPERGGEMLVRGEPVHLPVRDPERLGIAVIHQDLALGEQMTVTENLGIGTRFGTRGLRRVDWRAQAREARGWLARFGLETDPRALVGSLTPSERAMVAILRALRQLEEGAHDGLLLILDEPTTYLAAGDAARVVQMVRQVAATRVGVVFISHRLAEVIEVSDRITVLRNGRVLATVESAATSPPELVELMLGREVGALERQTVVPPTGEVAIGAEGVSGRVISDLSFSARGGEIVGVTGLTGMGQDELPYLLTGGLPLRAGRVIVHGTTIQRPSLQAIREQGVVLVPANRARDAVWMEGTALENLRLPLTRPAQRLRHHDEPGQAVAVMERFGVTPPAPGRLLQTFSGGNQQKIVLGKWLQSRPKVLLLHEPTIGVDAGARHDILKLIREAAADGNCVVVFSTDYEQLSEVCHRVLVLNYGRLSASLEGARVTESSILNAANAG